MTRPCKPEKPRPRRHKKKEFNFSPNKAQIIFGALLDIGRAIGRDHERIAKYIAEQWGETI